MIFYDEVFASIQGESSYIGIPSVFVRLYGCNLTCSYCDQPQEGKSKKRISIDNMMNKIKSFNLKYVCITGGEPLLQEEVFSLVYALVYEGFKVSIETNGCVPIDIDYYNRSFKYIMDIKCPSSGMSKHNIFSNLTNLKSIDEVKFVIANLEDYTFAKNILKKYPTTAQLLFSPMFDTNDKQDIGLKLSEWLLEDKLYRSRINIQLHKVLGVQ